MQRLVVWLLETFALMFGAIVSRYNVDVSENEVVRCKMERTMTKSATAKQTLTTKKKRKAIILTETQEILADPETMVALRRGIQEAKEGKSVPLAQVKAELGL